MATATYVTDLAFINDGANDSDMTAGTTDELDAPYNQGGTRAINEGDFFIQAAGCLAAALSASKSGFVFSLLWDAGSDKNADFATNDHLLIWQVLLAGNAMESTANNGLNVVIATSTAAADIHTVGGNDSGRNPYGGWQNFAVDPTRTPENELGVGGAGTNWRFFGSAVSTLVAITKGSPNAIDAFRVGRGQLTVEEGFTVAEGSFSGMATANDAQSARWGLFSSQGGSFLYKGLMSLGGTAALKFTDSNKNIIIDDSIAAQATFNAIEINHASTDISWTNISFSSLGTTSPGTFEMVDNATLAMEGCSFNNMDTFVFQSNVTADACTWNTCGVITGAGGDFVNSKVLTPAVTADTSGFGWDSATDTVALLAGMTFSMGATSHHAIDFGTSATGNITLTNCAFTGFGSTDNLDDSTVRFLATSGSLTLSLVGCTVDGVAATSGNFSVDDAAGIAVTLSIDPVAVNINVKDSGGNNLENARVYLVAEDGAGDLPFEETVVSISRSGTVATVDHTGHGLNQNEYVKLQGITDKVEDNLGAKLIATVPDVNTYTYATTNSGSTSYTGTITATGALIYGLTNVSGNVTASRTLAANQNVAGFIRKSTASPVFKTFSLAGNTVSNSTGLTLNVRLIPDE